MLSIALSKDGAKIVAGGYGLINVYEGTDLTKISEYLDAHIERVNSMAFSPADDSLSVSASGDGRIKV